MFKVKNKDTRTTFIVNFEHVIAGWVLSAITCLDRNLKAHVIGCLEQ